MCDVCEKKEIALGPRMLAFLGPERFSVEYDSNEHTENHRYPEPPSLTITNRYTGERLKLTADSDEGSSYFHWKKA